VPGPLVFPCAAIASLAVEPVSSPSLPSASIGAPPLALSAHTVPSPPPPSPPTTDWVVDSGASFHTTPTTSSLFHSHPPHPSHPSSIVVGNGSTLPVTSVGASVLPRPFCLNDVLASGSACWLVSRATRHAAAAGLRLSGKRRARPGHVPAPDPYPCRGPPHPGTFLRPRP
jgi:hypothetical protein